MIKVTSGVDMKLPFRSAFSADRYFLIRLTIATAITISRSTFSTAALMLIASRHPATAVTLPASVRFIGDYAFAYCEALLDILYQDSVTYVGANAFEEAAMTIVYVPDTCAEIGAEAFKNCKTLTQIRLPKNCSISDTAFTGCETVQVFAPGGGSTQNWCQNKTNIEFVHFGETD